MKMRSSFKAMALSFALAACAGEASDVPVPVAATAAIYATLLPEGGDTTVDMLPQETRTLTVRLLAAPSVPIPRSAVQFALVDSAMPRAPSRTPTAVAKSASPPARRGAHSRCA